MLGLFRFDETLPPAYCMCCGNPTFELYRGRDLRASLGLHHGRRFRWPEGRWPGDVTLADDAGERLCAWLAAHGETGSGRERGGTSVVAAKGRRRTAREAELLPLTVLDEFDPNDVDAPERGAHVLRKMVPDAAALGLLAFRLIGCAAGEEGVVQMAAYLLLEAEPIGAVVTAATAALADPEAAVGVGYWILYHADRKAIAEATLDELLNRAGLRMLTDGDPDVRGAAIQGLAYVGRPVAVPLLRRALAGRVLTSTPDGAEKAGAETAENKVRVVDALIDLKDRESLPRMRELAAGWAEAERKRFEERVVKTFPESK